jgi:predicted GNAT family acetyltransferase
MMNNHPAIENQQHGSGGRYVLTVDGLESEMTYVRDSGRMTIEHTFVPDTQRGRGLGFALVSRAVEDARAQGIKIVPVCSYAATLFARHPQWRDVLAG